MNEYFVQAHENQIKLSSIVPELIMLGDKILLQQTKFSHFENAVQVCSNLAGALGCIREITGYGRGLAAPQIGSSERCFVTFVDDAFQYYINPEITKYGDTKNRYRENCLSCGVLAVDVVRPESIVISYLNKDNEKIEEEHDGFMARLLQHEYDHLEGALNISKASIDNLELLQSNPLEEKIHPYAHE